MMFNQTSALLIAIQAYYDGQPYKFYQSSSYKEHWAKDQLQTMESLCLQKTVGDLKNEIDTTLQQTKIDHTTHQQFLVSANLNVLAKNSK
jgi:hypothetical protein